MSGKPRQNYAYRRSQSVFPVKSPVRPDFGQICAMIPSIHETNLKMSADNSNIVIVGGGFAGTTLARLWVCLPRHSAYLIMAGLRPKLRANVACCQELDGPE